MKHKQLIHRRKEAARLMDDVNIWKKVDNKKTNIINPPVYIESWLIS